MPKVYSGNEFEALKCRFENQTELLSRLTQIDLKIFYWFFTLQLIIGAWFIKNIGNEPSKIAFLVIDIVIAFIAFMFIYRNYQRRKEVVQNVQRCTQALGFTEAGIYLENESLDWHPKDKPFPITRYWIPFYFIGILVSVIGIAIILLY